MKLTVTLLLLAAIARAEVSTQEKTEKIEELKTEKRALVEGNAGVEKRAPLLPTVPPSTSSGIEYAEAPASAPATKSNQIYATQTPQIAKISDVLTGQGAPFHTAIASHLFAPVSVYQARLAAPAYEVSPPIPSQLAYSETKVYQPNQFAQQYTQKVPLPKEAIAKLTANYQNGPIYLAQANFAQPQNYIQAQSLQYQQVPVNQPQLIYSQQIPLNPQQYQPQVYYTQQPQQVIQYVPQQPPNNIHNVQVPPPPQVRYTRPEEQKESQRDVKNEQQAQVELNTSFLPKQSGEQQGAVSYASFSVGQPTAQAQAQYEQQQQEQNKLQQQEQNQLQQQEQNQLQQQEQNQLKQQEQEQQLIREEQQLLQQERQQQQQHQLLQQERQQQHQQQQYLQQQQQQYQQQQHQLQQQQQQYQHHQQQYQQQQRQIQQQQYQQQYQTIKQQPQIQYQQIQQVQPQQKQQIFFQPIHQLPSAQQTQPQVFKQYNQIPQTQTRFSIQPQQIVPFQKSEVLQPNQIYSVQNQPTVTLVPRPVQEYFRQGASARPVQPDDYRRPGHGLPPQESPVPIYQAQPQPLSAPAYPNVQYFGKFAEQIFGKHK